mmetsp:Transcript_26439/g.40061  ORF Transcript_26439/g.40061 Transcript_26439/m.40061 type:complete len:91 (+) Transcript_26439:1128-1400(+)
MGLLRVGRVGMLQWRCFEGNGSESSVWVAGACEYCLIVLLDAALLLVECHDAADITELPNREKGMFESRQEMTLSSLLWKVGERQSSFVF